jgi:hypothetical protein
MRDNGGDREKPQLQNLRARNNQFYECSIVGEDP